MIEFYPQIRLFHIFAVLLSGSIFALRGVAALAGARWPQARPLKWLTYAIDTSLLTAALLLVAILPWSVFANGWLLAKIALLFAYVVLGVLALRPPRPRAVFRRGAGDLRPDVRHRPRAPPAGVAGMNAAAATTPGD